MSFDVMRPRLHLRGVQMTGVVEDTPAELVVGVVSVRTLSSCPFCGRFIASRCMTVAGGRSAIWSTAAARRCCYGPSGGSCAVPVGNGTWKTIASSKAALPGNWPVDWSRTLR